jgi:hypothetical protein
VISVPRKCPALSDSIQETTKTAADVNNHHAAAATAAAAAGALVSVIPDLTVRTAGNIAEMTLDPAAVVAFDSGVDLGLRVPSSCQQQQQEQQGAIGSTVTTSWQSQSQSQHQQHNSSTIVAVDSVGSAGAIAPGSGAGRLIAAAPLTLSSSVDEWRGLGAVLPDKVADVADTVGRLRAEGQLAVPDCGEDDTSRGNLEAFDRGGGTIKYLQLQPEAAVDGGSEKMAGGANYSANDCKGEDVSCGRAKLMVTHEEAAKAAAVAGALVHVGHHVATAADLAAVATATGLAMDALAAEGTGQQQQQQPSESAAAAAMQRKAGRQRSSASIKQQQYAAADNDVPDLNIMMGLVSVGPSTSVISEEGNAVSAAAVVPDEAVQSPIADQQRNFTLPNQQLHSPKPVSPSAAHTDRSSSAAGAAATGADVERDEGAEEGIPTGSLAAQLVAATIASEERRFRAHSPVEARDGRVVGTPCAVQCPGGSYPGNGSSSSTDGQQVVSDTQWAGSRPPTAAKTKAIFETVQRVVQKKQLEVEQQQQYKDTASSSSSTGDSSNASSAAAAERSVVINPSNMPGSATSAAGTASDINASVMEDVEAQWGKHRHQHQLRLASVMTCRSSGAATAATVSSVASSGSAAVNDSKQHWMSARSDMSTQSTWGDEDALQTAVEQVDGIAGAIMNDATVNSTSSTFQGSSRDEADVSGAQHAPVAGNSSSKWQDSAVGGGAGAPGDLVLFGADPLPIDKVATSAGSCLAEVQPAELWSPPALATQAHAPQAAELALNVDRLSTTAAHVPSAVDDSSGAAVATSTASGEEVLPPLVTQATATSAPPAAVVLTPALQLADAVSATGRRVVGVVQYDASSSGSDVEQQYFQQQRQQQQQQKKQQQPTFTAMETAAVDTPATMDIPVTQLEVIIADTAALLQAAVGACQGTAELVVAVEEPEGALQSKDATAATASTAFQTSSKEMKPFEAESTGDSADCSGSECWMSGRTVAGQWQDSGRTVAGQWQDSGRTVAGQWQDSGRTDGLLNTWNHGSRTNRNRDC